MRDYIAIMAELHSLLPLHVLDEKTQVLDNPADIDRAIAQVFSNIKHNYDACVDAAGPTVAMGVEAIKKLFLEAHNRGVKIRIIAEITKDNLYHCKQLMEIAELRHIDGVLGNFGISEAEYIAAATLEEEKPLSVLIYSNANQIIRQHQFIFQTLWNKAIPANQKIREIEEGVEPEFIEVITDREKANSIVLTLAKSAKKEVLIILPNDKALVRAKTLTMLDALASLSNEHGVKVRIICPISDINSKIVDWITHHTSIELLNGKELQSGIVLVDSTHFFTAELVKPLSGTFSDAIGIALYSNSKRTVNLLKSLFDALWENAETVRKLEVHDKLQKAFINVAAHELRTPVQPILGRAEILKAEIQAGDYNKELLLEAVDMIIRNSQRLQRLTDDLLTISKIDRQVLTLNKTNFDFGLLIKEVIHDIKNQLGIISKGITIIHHQPKEKKIIVNADKDKITHVIYNLLSNAIKFTEQGYVSISTERDDATGSIIFTIKDTGTGIDLSLFPRLFQMFATNITTSSLNQSGSGIGLYISKNIIEAHGGKIWAKNNEDEKGATFTFMLPSSLK